MNNTIIISALLVIATATGLAAAPKSTWSNSLKPKGASGAEITLAKDGKALYSVLIPTGASAQEQKAADDLAYWLGSIAGAKFEIQREPDGGAVKGKFISIGRTRLFESSGLRVAQSKLQDEGYAIASKDGNLFVLGGATRGPINAVYALLEEDLGCRWYSRFSQKIPSMPTLRFRPVTRSYAPALEIRDPFYWEAFDGTWSLRNRTNSSAASVPVEWGGNKHYAMFVHTFEALAPPSQYFDQHPEYYSEHNGKRVPLQLCFSNKEVVKVVADNAKRILRASPESQIISVSQNDSHPCCACAECKAAGEAEGSMAGPLLTFVNAVAEEVGKEFPKVRISTLAYLDTAAPPKTVRPAKNVAIQLCTDCNAWPEPFLTIEESANFVPKMESWAAMGSDIHIWDYTCNFSHYPGPMPNWQVVTDSIRYFVKHNAKGVMLQGNYQTPGTADGYMRCWVWAKQLWDPRLDTRALMKDFVYGYYGAAADAIWDYQELLWDTWEKQHTTRLKSPPGGIRYGMDIFDDEFMTRARDCFARATELAKLDTDPETLRRVEEGELQVLYASVCRQAKPGKPADPMSFKTDLDKFERVARRQKMTHIQEGNPDFEAWVAKMRALGTPE